MKKEEVRVGAEVVFVNEKKKASYIIEDIEKIGNEIKSLHLKSLTGDIIVFDILEKLEIKTDSNSRFDDGSALLKFDESKSTFDISYGWTKATKEVGLFMIQCKDKGAVIMSKDQIKVLFEKMKKMESEGLIF